MFDDTSLKRSRELDKLCLDLGASCATIQACHILNESTMQGVDPTGASEERTVTDNVCAATMSRVSRRPPSPTSIVQTEYAVNAISVLKDFGLGSLPQELLETNGVHDLGNLLSLETNVHTHFDRLNLWFEGTNEVHRLWTSR